MPLVLESYDVQRTEWPSEGRHILAQFGDGAVVVYQAYSPEIGHFAATNGYFGGAFSFSRMTWIKPNFLWMMYRSGWGTKPGQELVLAIELVRSYFDRLLAEAVPSQYVRELYEDRESWSEAVRRSPVRLQWDPDHDPFGHPVKRRAIQIGIRGEALDGFRGDGISSIEDISRLVAEQRLRRGTPELQTPHERIYWPGDAIAARLGSHKPQISRLTRSRAQLV